MAEFKVLLVEDAPETVLILKNVLEFKELKWILAKNSQEATRLLHEHCPHLLVVDISLGPEDNGLEWLKEVKKGPFGHIHSIVMTSSAFKEDVQQSIQLGVDDYILKPADHVSLTKKINIVRKKLEAEPSYSFKAVDGAQIEAHLNLHGRIRAISETGLCISSAVTNLTPLSLTQFQTDLFEELGVPPPQRLTLMNYEREARTKDGFPFRNYCQVQGWQEKDLQKIRVWIRGQRLSRSF